MKNRGLAIVLALFLGGLGIHKFYVGKVGQGFLYLIFCWTLIPSVIGLIDLIRWVIMDDKKFHELYDVKYTSIPTN